MSLEFRTRGQRVCDEWNQARKFRLTASNFKKALQDAMTHEKAKNMLKDIINRNIQYGIDNEPNARETYEMVHDTNVQLCGLFVSEEYNFLGASPGKN